MKTTITKEIHHSILAEGDELQSLCGFISSRYKDTEISAQCIDGSKLETKDIKEILSFENPNYRKIKNISFQAHNDFDERLSFDIWADRTFTSAELRIESQDDEQALYATHEILNKLREMKPWYDLLARIPISYVVFGLWFLWGMWITANQLIGLRPPAASLTKYSIFESLNIAVLITIIAFAIVYPFDWVQKRIFPKVFFLIGKQKKTMETIKKWRGFIFGGILLAIVTGIIGNAISNWLLK